jgi:hypothetical protein
LAQIVRIFRASFHQPIGATHVSEYSREQHTSPHHDEEKIEESEKAAEQDADDDRGKEEEDDDTGS